MRRRSWMLHRLPTLSAALVLLSISIFALPHRVSAHPEVVSTDPPRGALLDHPPAVITLAFSEPVDILADSIVVLDPLGRTVQTGRNARVDATRTVVQIPLESVGAQGTYTVRYAVIGTDGHLVSGRFTFSVGTPSSTGRIAEQADLAPILHASARLLYVLGLSLLLASLVLALTVPETVRNTRMRALPDRLALLAAGLTASAAVTAFGALFSLSWSPSSLASVRALVTTRTGLLWLVVAFMAAAIAAVQLAPVRQKAKLLVMSTTALVLVVARALTGHAVTAPLPATSVAFAALHTASAATVLGTVLVLPLLARLADGLDGSKPLFPRRLIRRWVVMIVIATEILVITGAYALWINVSSPLALVDTWYGRVLLAKFVLIAVFGFPLWLAFRRQIHTQPLHPFTIRLAGITALLVLLAGGALSLLTPARVTSSGETTKAAVLTLARNAGPYLVTLELQPALPGPNQVTATVTAPNGEPVDEARVTVALEGGPEPRLVQLTSRSPQHVGTLLLDARRWDLVVYVQVPGDEEVHAARFDVPIPVPDGLALLQLVDQAMNRLTSVEERTLLTSGGPTVETIARYQAPDRVAYTVRSPDQPPRETVIVDTRRYDRSEAGTWIESPWPGARPYRWPTYRYAETAENVRILGLETIDRDLCYTIAFFDAGSNTHFRLWVGTTDFRIRRYEMMAPGHYMTGSFARFDDSSIRVEPPAAARATAEP